MTTTATLVYKAFKGGSLSLSDLNSLLSSVPPPVDILTFLGCRVTSDVTIDGPPVTRTIVVSLVPSATATATAFVEPDDLTGSKVTHVDVTSPGADYVLPPVVVFSGGRATEAVGKLDNDKFSASAAAIARLKIATATVLGGGFSYSADTTINVVGGLPPGAKPAKLTPIIAGGIITGVTITDAGSDYTTTPEIVITDSTGSGATIAITMGVGRVVLMRGGVGYIVAPTVTLIPAFKVMFPDVVGAQAGAFADLMTSVLSAALNGPVDAEPPLIA